MTEQEQSAPRDFDAEYDLANRTGKQFRLGGHTFTTKGVPPVAAFRGKERGLDAAIKFLQDVLIPEDREIFTSMLDDAGTLISGPQIDDVASWLISELSERPTPASDSSGSTGAQSETSSKAALSSVDETP